MKNKKNVLIHLLSLTLLFGLLFNSAIIQSNAKSNSNDTIIIHQDDGSTISLIPLSQEETDLLLKEAESQPPRQRLTNTVTARPVKVNSSKIAVQFNNKGFILDYVDYVETNLLVWHAKDNNIRGFRMVYYRLPSGSHNTSSVYVSGWKKAQTIGGFYVDGFGSEIGIGGASGYIYN